MIKFKTEFKLSNLKLSVFTLTTDNADKWHKHTQFQFPYTVCFLEVILHSDAHTDIYLLFDDVEFTQISKQNEVNWKLGNGVKESRKYNISLRESVAK